MRKMGMAKKYHSITDIVAVVYCEQKAVFDRQQGRQPPREVAAKAAAGQVEHWRFQIEGQTQRAMDRRCYIASAVYGAEAEQTDCLRQWRDAVLMPSRVGRWGVWCYYRLSPWLVRGLGGSRLCRAVARRVLDSVVWWIRRGR